jgi:hypothetical protein
MPPFTVNLNAGRGALPPAFALQPPSAVPLDDYRGEIALAGYAGWGGGVGGQHSSYGSEVVGGMRYGNGMSSSSGAHDHDAELAGVNYVLPFQAAAVPVDTRGGGAGVEAAMGAGLQGQREKHQQLNFQQQAANAPPPVPLIKFNAPKLLTGSFLPSTPVAAHAAHLDAWLQMRAPPAKLQKRRCAAFSFCLKVCTSHATQPSFEVGGVAITRRPGAGGGPVVRPSSSFLYVCFAYILRQVRDPFGSKPKSQDAPRCAILPASFIAWLALFDLQLGRPLDFDAVLQSWVWKRIRERGCEGCALHA